MRSLRQRPQRRSGPTRACTWARYRTPCAPHALLPCDTLASTRQPPCARRRVACVCALDAETAVCRDGRGGECEWSAVRTRCVGQRGCSGVMLRIHPCELGGAQRTPPGWYMLRQGYAQLLCISAVRGSCGLRSLKPREAERNSPRCCPTGRH